MLCRTVYELRYEVAAVSRNVSGKQTLFYMKGRDLDSVEEGITRK
jgi:hypothetical protein